LKFYVFLLKRCGIQTAQVKVVRISTDFTDQLVPFLPSSLCLTTTSFFAFARSLSFGTNADANFAAFLVAFADSLASFLACFVACFGAFFPTSESSLQEHFASELQLAMHAQLLRLLFVLY
jgi:hypothetical protein